LYAQDVDQRSATFEKAVEMGRLYQRRARLLILRSALIKHNVVVKTHHGSRDPSVAGSSSAAADAGIGGN
jgi:COP9 signalosome complex subunit 1